MFLFRRTKGRLLYFGAASSRLLFQKVDIQNRSLSAFSVVSEQIMSKLKLYYFDGKGRGEAARLILIAAGKEFEDIRFSEEEWPKYKPLSPFGQAPFLDVGGKLYDQSWAIKAYLARELGFYGKTSEESLRIDQITHWVEDLTNAVVPSLFIENKEEGKKAIEKIKTEVSPKFLGHFEKFLKESGTNYFVGDRITLADIAVLDVATGMLEKAVDINDSYPLLKKNLQIVKAHNKIGPYLASRPITPF